MIFGTGGFSARVGIPSNPDRRKMLLRQTVTAHLFPLGQAVALKCPERLYARLKERWDELLKENPDGNKVKVRMKSETVFELRDPLHFSLHGYVEQFCRFNGEKAIFGFYLIPHDQEDDFYDEYDEDAGPLHRELDPQDEEQMKLYRTNGAEVLGDDPRLTALPPDEIEFLESVWKCVPKINEIRRSARELGPNDRCSKCGKKIKRCRCGG